MRLTTPPAIRTLQRRLYVKAKTEPSYRFYRLYDKVSRTDILAHAYALARANRGAAGVEGMTFEQVESQGLTDWLARLQEDLRTRTIGPRRFGGYTSPSPVAVSARSGFRQSETASRRPRRSSCCRRSSRRTSRTHVDIEQLEAELRAEVVASNGALVSPPIVVAWTIKQPKH